MSGAPRSLRVCLCSPEMCENITPVLEAMGGETCRKGRNNIFPLRDISSRVTRVFPSLCYLCGKRLLDRRLILWNYVWYLNGGFSTSQTSKPSLLKILAG